MFSGGFRVRCRAIDRSARGGDHSSLDDLTAFPVRANVTYEFASLRPVPHHEIYAKL
jgi:hypothetical protein